MQVVLEPPPALPFDVSGARPGVVVTSGAVGEPAPGKPPWAWVPDSAFEVTGVVVSLSEPEPQPAATTTNSRRTSPRRVRTGASLGGAGAKLVADL